MNVAARLEQAACAGADVHRSRYAEPRPRRGPGRGGRASCTEGKGPAGRGVPLLEVLPESEGLARHPEALLVGRERERNRLWRDFEDVLDDRSCRLVTLLGPAGIGKSRLVADFLERVGDSADVLRGRCLSYGEGITYWPLVEILIAIGVEPDARNRHVPARDTARVQAAPRSAGRGAAAGGASSTTCSGPSRSSSTSSSTSRICHATRRSSCSASRGRSSSTSRPDWGGGKLNATSLLLEPLGDDECAALIGESPRRDPTRRRAARPHHGRICRQPSVRRGDARNGARARRGWGDRRPADDPCAPPGSHRLARQRRPRRDGARFGGGRGVPSRRSGATLAALRFEATSSRT